MAETGVMWCQVSTTTDRADGISARIAEAAERLGLDRLGTAVMSLAAAPEIDPRFGRLFAYLNDDADQRLATPRLLGAVRFVEASGPAVDRPGAVAARLAGFLLGAPYWDPRNCSEGNEPARRGGADPELAWAGHHLPALTP